MLRAGPRLGVRAVAVGVPRPTRKCQHLPGGHRPAALRRERLDQRQSEEVKSYRYKSGPVVGCPGRVEGHPSKVISVGGVAGPEAGVAGPSRFGVVLSR